MESPVAAPEALLRPPVFAIGAVVVAVTAVLTTVEEGEMDSPLAFGAEETVTATSSVEAACIVELHGGDEDTAGCCC